MAGLLSLALVALSCAYASPAGAEAPSGPPVNSSLPAVKGTPLDGKTLKTSEGSWNGLKGFSYTYAWQRCNASGGECTPVAGEKSLAYLVSGADVGHTLRSVVTASNADGNATATSLPSAEVGPSAPRKKTSPLVSGAAQDGQVLNALNGTWKGTQPQTYSYQWQSCHSGPCVAIPGATQATYRAATAQLGTKLRVLVTATNSAGKSTVASKKTAKVIAGPPVNVGAPTISGTPVVTQTLTAETGSWAGTGPFAYTYQWRSCNLLGECEDIPGATGPTFTVSALQVADSIEVAVTATSQLGSSTATSAQSALIGGLLPSNTGLPSITGLLQDGGLLSALSGSWSGTEPLSFSYVWETCDAAGANCEPIAGALGSTLGLIAGEVGQTVRVAVTATNAAGSATATSPVSGLISGLLPANVGLPSITGLLEDGGLLKAFKGTWSGTEPISFSYAWELCDAAGAGCEAISGALGTTLSLIGADVGDTVRLVVTATNQTGSTSATSEPTGLVGALLPSNTGLPSILGSLIDGSSLTGAPGTWSGTEPLSFGYQWQQCNASGGDCKDISGATSLALGLISSEVGSTVRLVVTATNSAGSTSAASQPTGLIGALLPSNTGLPSITGLLQDGSALSGVTGSWDGTAPLSFGYQWLLCNASGGSCKEVSGATGSTLGLLTGMIGSTVRLVVTATNAAGSTSATSEPTSVIKALLPSNTGLPSISGLLQDTGLLTAGTGSWAGSEPLSFGYQWLLCNGSGGSCKEVSGATGSTLGLLTGMIGSTVRLVVTATNAAGSTSATSEPTGLIKALLPSNTALPSIAGTLVDGSSLTGAKGSWTGSEPSFSYQWLLCNASGGSCKEVSGATGSTLGLLTGMIGSTVRLVVTATNGAGSTSATSEPTGLIKALLPSNTGLPSITGLAEDGSTLTGAKGSWTGSEPSFSYQWLLCNGTGGECKEVSGATGSTLGLLTGEIGKTVRLAVTATNSAGATTARSEPTSAILAILPANTVIPSISGVLQTGKLLTAVEGKWTGSAPITYTFQWQTCGLLGKENECTNILNAIKSTFELNLAQVGLTMRVLVTATNARGAVSKASTITGLIGGLLLTPGKGSSEGGTAVKLSAPNVSRVTAVHFGSSKATEIEVDSPNEITAVSPAGSEGQVPVTVTTPEGSSHGNPEDMFTYEP